MLSVYWLVKFPVGEILVFKLGRKPRRIVLAPVAIEIVRGLLNVTAVLVSAHVAAIDSPARVVAETPGLPLTALCVGTRVAVSWLPRVQFRVILATCWEVAKPLLFRVPKLRFWVLFEPMAHAGLTILNLRVNV